MTIEHGQDATRQTSALWIHSVQLPVISEGMIAMTSDSPIITGVYTAAKRVISFSWLPLLFELSSTSLTMRVAALSAYALVVLRYTVLSLFIMPLSSSAPTVASTGSDSPVREEASTVVLPSVMIPSTGTRVCGGISRMVPISTSSALT